MATKSERAELDEKALKLRRAGVSPALIAEQLGMRNTAAAEAAILRALDAQGGTADPATVRALELDRLDQLQRAVWVLAVQGDMKAIDQVKQLAEMRVRLSGIAQRGQSVLTEAYDATIAQLDLEPEDAAAIASGRRVAERIDAAAAAGDATVETKALYLLPHLMNILDALGATPAARAELKAKAKSGDTDKRAKLRALRGGQAS